MGKHELKVLKKTSLIGYRVRLKRQELNITVFNLAVDSGCSVSIISDLERGVSCGITIRTLVKISEALKITPEELFNE